MPSRSGSAAQAQHRLPHDIADLTTAAGVQHKLATLGKAASLDSKVELSVNLDTASLMQQADCVRQLGEHFRGLVSLYGRQPEFITTAPSTTQRVVGRPR